MKKLLLVLIILVLLSCNRNKQNTVSDIENSEIISIFNEMNFEPENVNIRIVQSTMSSQDFFNQTILNGNIAELENVLTLEQLYDFSRSDLRILRNTIFAKYGYKFNSIDLQEHFLKFSWYDGVLANVDDKLTVIDIGNIELIQMIEQNYPEESDLINKLIGNWYMYGGIANEGIDKFSTLISNDHVQILPNGIYVHYCRVHFQSEEIFYGFWSLENNIFETIMIGNDKKHDFPPNYGKTDFSIYEFDFNDGSIYPGCHLFGSNGGGWVKE